MTGKPSHNALRITGIPPKLGNAVAVVRDDDDVK
jgi:hypothetical protein